MITAMMLCGYLASAHAVIGCHPAKSHNAATMTVNATATPAMLVFDPRPGAIETITASLENEVGATVVRGEWVDFVFATKGEIPEAVRTLLDMLDSAAQYAAAARQDAAHLRDAKNAHDLLGTHAWAERLGEDRNQLAEATSAWVRLTGRGLPVMPAKAVQE